MPNGVFWPVWERPTPLLPPTSPPCCPPTDHGVAKFRESAVEISPAPPPATAASSASTVASFEESMKMIRIRFPISLILIPEKWKMENPRGKIGKKKKKTNKSNTGKENEDISKPRQIEFCGRKWPTLAMETLRKFTKSITDPKLATVTCVRKVKVEKSIAAKPPPATTTATTLQIDN